MPSTTANIVELEALQDDVLRRLDDLERRLEAALACAGATFKLVPTPDEERAEGTAN